MTLWISILLIAHLDIHPPLKLFLICLSIIIWFLHIAYHDEPTRDAGIRYIDSRL
jgi:hypothetical protein